MVAAILDAKAANPRADTREMEADIDDKLVYARHNLTRVAIKAIKQEVN